MTKSIAIIGATGTMGSSIAKALPKNSKYRLLLMSRESEKLDDLKLSLRESGADVDAMICAKEASWEADIILIATPYEAEMEVAEKIREVAIGKIVISISNPLNKAGDDLLTPPDTSAAEELQRMLPNSKVVKAFNTTFASSLMTPVIEGKTSDAFIAGNDDEAVGTVMELVKAVGFNPIVAGDLAVSRTLERMQLLFIKLAMKDNYNWVAGWKILHH